MRRRQFAQLLLCLAYSLSPGAFAASPDAVAVTANADQTNSAPKTFKLQGRAEVLDARPRMDPRLQAWQADMNYRRGAMALANNDFKVAADFFQQAGDGFEAAVGPGKPLAEARYAQAQACRLAKLDAESEKLFRVAVDLFRKYDPANPYLKAGQGYLDQIAKKDIKLKAKASSVQLKGQATQMSAEVSESPLKLLPPIEGQLDNVDRHVVLKGKNLALASGLKDDEFFAGTKLQSEAGLADLSEKYVKDRIYKGFVKMTCLEFASLGGNYYTAPDNYKPFVSDDGKAVIIGATDDNWNPGIPLKLNGKEYNVSMYLPGLTKSSKNVMLVTDDRHVLAIDPRKEDIWKLVPVFNKNGTADFSWWKLTHQKRNNNISCTAKPPASPFARKASK